MPWPTALCPSPTTARWSAANSFHRGWCRRCAGADLSSFGPSPPNHIHHSARGGSMRAIQYLNGISLAISKFAAYLAALVLCLMVGHIIFEIILRAFSRSTYIMDEMVGYGVAGTTFLALAHSFETSALIRVNLLLEKLERGGMARRVVELFCSCSTLWVMTIVIQYFWNSVSRNFIRGAVSETIAEIPLWIPEGVVLIGMAVFWLQLLTYTLRILFGELPQRADVAMD
ncbi:MAG: TRAP transporter small permease [Alphaproteobacteria bacterium]|nr:TRAP transporter small permease [Alphaproteobacteria bacterium]